MLPSDAASTLERTLAEVLSVRRTGLVSLGALVRLWASSNGMATVMTTMNKGVGRGGGAAVVAATAAGGRPHHRVRRVILLMLWFYLTSYVLVVGAEVDAEIEKAARAETPRRLPRGA